MNIVLQAKRCELTSDAIIKTARNLMKDEGGLMEIYSLTDYYEYAKHTIDNPYLKMIIRNIPEDLEILSRIIMGSFQEFMEFMKSKDIIDMKLYQKYLLISQLRSTVDLNLALTYFLMEKTSPGIGSRKYNIMKMVGIHHKP